MIKAIKGFLNAETDKEQIFWLDQIDKRIVKIIRPILLAGGAFVLGHIVRWLISL